MDLCEGHLHLVPLSCLLLEISIQDAPLHPAMACTESVSLCVMDPKAAVLTHSTFGQAQMVLVITTGDPHCDWNMTVRSLFKMLGLNSAQGSREDASSSIFQERLKATTVHAQAISCRRTVFGVALQLVIKRPVFGLQRGGLGQLFQPGYASLHEALQKWAP